MIPASALACILFLFSATFSVAFGQETDGAYALVKHDLPATLAPGQTLIGHVRWRVIRPGAPLHNRPIADLSALGPVKRNLRLPAAKMVPWRISGEQAAGTEFDVTFTLDVPIDFPEGDAEIGLLLARNVAGKGWQYAQLRDSAGSDLGRTFRWQLRITRRKAENSAAVLAVPVTVRRMRAPQIDGRVDAAEWKDAGVIAALRESTGGGPAAASSRVYLGYDDVNLYVAFVCDEPALSKTARTPVGKHDGPVWNNDCVEIFLDPRADRVSYVHFIVDILNQRFDALGADAYGFNPSWRSAAFSGDDVWSVEVAVPFSALGVAVPEPGSAWCANFCRERKAEAELTAWQPTFGSFAAPGRFGVVVFGSLATHLQVEARKLDLGDTAGWPGELGQAVADWDAKVAQLREQAAQLDEADALAAYSEQTVTRRALATEARRLRLRASTLSGSTLAIARACPYQAFRGMPGPIDRPAGPVSISLLQGEWLDLAWNVTNPTDRAVVFRATVRRGTAADAQAFLRLGLPGLKTLWRQAVPVAAGDGRAVYDALVPIPAGTVTVPAGATAQVWLSVAAPANADSDAAGYLCFDPIDGSPGEPVVIPLTVTLVPVSVRTVRPVHCFSWNLLMLPVADDSEWLAAHLRDLAEHGVDVCMIHGLRQLPRPRAGPDGTLAETLDFSRVDRLLDAADGLFGRYFMTLDIFEKGDLRRDLFGLDWGTPAYEKAFKEWLRAVLDHLSAEGIEYDRLLLNPYDESVGPECQTLARWVKEVDSRVRIIIDCSTTDLEQARQMDAVTDVWCPHHKYHMAEDHAAFFALLRESGKPRWCYFYSQGGNDKAQDPARHYLGKFWWAFSEGISGLGYWAQQYYGDPWYRAAWKSTYDTSLVYPVPGGVIPSRRWEAWRRGWQDANLLQLARESIRKSDDAEAMAEFQTRLRETVAVPGDPEHVDATRTWLKNVLIHRNPGR